MKASLIIQLARFGDLVQSKRLVLSLQDLGREVHLCIDRSLAPLAERLFPAAVLHPVIAHGAKSSSVRAILENRIAFDEIASLTFSDIYNLNFSPLNFRLATLFDPDRIRGYRMRGGQELVDPWAALAVRWSRERRIGLNLVDFWAAYAPAMRAPGEVNPAARPHGNGIGVVLAGRESRRSLPVPLLVRILEAVWKGSARPGSPLLLVGSSAESPAARALLKEMPPAMRQAATDLTGKTDWNALVDLVSGLDRVLTPDTGVMHLAAHLGVPTTAFFLSSAWCFETGPYGSGHTVYQAVDTCLPCLETRPCPHKIRCLQGFSQPEFLRFMNTGKSAHVPPGLLGFTSGFDPLGVVYRAFGGTDADADRRTAFRAFVGEHLGISMPEADTNIGAQFANSLYREADWIVAPESKRTEDTQCNHLIL